ncbi:MAG: nucleoside triphosphate pyrophosphohydrolase family protein [Pseudomonadota bacterium]
MNAIIDLELDQYQTLAMRTDKSAGDAEGPNLLLLGLFGEIGSLLSELKKKQRDKSAYYAYGASAVEELGDVVWYLSNIAHRRGVLLSHVAARAFMSPHETDITKGGEFRTFKDLQPQKRLFLGPHVGSKVEQRLLMLGARASSLLEAIVKGFQDADAFDRALGEIFRTLVDAAEDADVSLDDAAQKNLTKIETRWPIQRNWGDLYDASRDEDEKFPNQIRILFKEKMINGKKYVIQKCNGLNIGDRLTDNRQVEDDYRFHDVFHLAFAAILGWSPVLRALLKLKRKSDDKLDEQQDGARAIIAEEGISNWIFSQGLRHGLFETVDSLDFTILKTIQDMVKGYEVENRPFWMWEHAILEGFRIFRLLKEARGGTVVADFEKRALIFER